MDDRADVTRRPPYDGDVYDVLRWGWRYRWLLLSVPGLLGGLAILASFGMTEIYRAEVLLAPVEPEGLIEPRLGSLGGLASLAGISIPTGGTLQENLSVLTSRAFIREFIADNTLLPILFAERWDPEAKRWKGQDPPSLWDGYRRLVRGSLQVDHDTQTGLVTVTIDWRDPALAAEWANELVRRLNDYLRRQAIARSSRNLAFLQEALEGSHVNEMRQTLFQLIEKEQRTAMLAGTQAEFALRVLDPAIPPDRRLRPDRMILGALGVCFGAFLALAMAWLHSSYRRGITQLQS